MKKRIKEKICRSSKALRLMAFKSRRIPRIFMYHRFTARDCDDGLVVSGKNFAWQLEQLRRGPWKLMTLAEYVFRRRRGFEIPSYTVILTIDDGYRDFYEVAYPVLRQYGFPATFFVTARFIDGNFWLWHDRLRYAIENTGVDSVGIVSGQASFELRTSTDEERERTWNEVTEYCTDIPDREKWRLIDAVESALRVEVPDSPTDDYAAATWEQLKEMAENGVEIGAHSLTHPVLSHVSPFDLPDEIYKPREMISFCLGRPVTTICYPNGRKIDATREVMELVEEAGYLGGVIGGGNDFSDLLRLPRLGLGNDHRDFLWKLSGFEYLTMKSPDYPVGMER